MLDDHQGPAEWVRAALDEHEGPLVRYATRLTGNLDRARDVVQDTFLKLCAQNREKIEPHVAEWLFTVCRHRALDIRRKEQRMQPLETTAMADPPSDAPSPSTVAANREATGQVTALLATLPPNQQEVIRLKFQSDLSYREIAHITGLSVSNVGFLLHTAIKTLRQQMQSAEGVPHAI